ncbi:ABC transporter permease [Alicyclobacillus tolerans]|uniref:ABC transporter permease n=1 Tax=Alicyclobacillus tolerans TaxID=90970 RepID=UPI001F351F78|nr:ABC transporter permease [Alicyclobacillus tolerans]MCF8565387.1 ABC transporter permease [Alicyclobacillus tolerans]
MAVKESNLYVPPTQAAQIKKSAFWKSVRQFPMIYVGGLIIALLILVAVFAPVIATHNPIHQFSNGLNPDGTPVAPSRKFIFGTDGLGRDVFSRVVYGARVSLIVGVVATAVSLLIGTVVGLVSGFVGGWIDYVLQRLTDVILAFPFLLFTMALVAILKPDLQNVIIAIAVTGWGGMARIVRGSVLSAREFEYVQAERAIGASIWRIMFRVILPNIFGPVLVLATLNVGFAMLTEAGLSYLGIGVQPPTPSWGNMIQDGMQTYQYAPWTLYAPGIALVLAVLGFNLLGDGLRDLLDPHNVTHG